MPFSRLRFRLCFGVKAVEHRPTAGRIINHAVQRVCNGFRIDVSVIWEERTDAGQCKTLVVGAIIPRQYQIAETEECTMTQDISYGALTAQMAAPACTHIFATCLRRRSRLRTSANGVKAQRENQSRHSHAAESDGRDFEVAFAECALLHNGSMDTRPYNFYNRVNPAKDVTSILLKFCLILSIANIFLFFKGVMKVSYENYDEPQNRSLAATRTGK
jgi:hypothetical protein